MMVEIWSYFCRSRVNLIIVSEFLAEGGIKYTDHGFVVRGIF